MKSTAPLPSLETQPATRLSELAVGERGKVTGFDAASYDPGRLLEMGVTQGATIEAVRVAPLGDPIDFKVRGYHLSLRRREATAIYIERL
ncbi:MAG TPA: FeoA family protein [Chthoniobacteraceae bacterium]|nr:FeoA family protein [Chthoniobacteraceae bacterium]